MVNQKQAITVNYWVCFLVGFLFLPSRENLIRHFSFDWVPWALILGFLFLLNFRLTGLIVKKLGLAVSSVSNKMSLVIPVIFSLYAHQNWDQLSVFSYLGLGLAFLAIFFVSGPVKSENSKKSGMLIFLPIIIFLLSGLTDSLSQWCSETKVNQPDSNHFAWLVFAGAAISSSLLILVQSFNGKVSWNLNSILAGFTLGIPNYFSYYFLLKSLEAFDHQGDFVFPFANLGIILFSGLLSFFVFSDQISRRQWLGLGLSGLSLFLISIKTWM